MANWSTLKKHILFTINVCCSSSPSFGVIFPKFRCIGLEKTNIYSTCWRPEGTNLWICKHVCFSPHSTTTFEGRSIFHIPFTYFFQHQFCCCFQLNAPWNLLFHAHGATNPPIHPGFKHQPDQPSCSLHHQAGGSGFPAGVPGVQSLRTKKTQKNTSEKKLEMLLCMFLFFGLFHSNTFWKINTRSNTPTDLNIF